ncbi:hypothetical protein NA78x_003735 [Anatilimnocola sp. NA78]|uniref:hypothetical protein n=1 Tax=Anatilimnocola sp. NA78 TaxID=3415683 RepID=UPI003CE4AC31
MDLAALATNDNHTTYVAATVVLAATLPAAVVLLAAFRSLSRTTLIVPWSWSVISFGLAVASCLYAAIVPIGERPAIFTSMQFVAACGTLCPLVALIGAKRPQHAAWSFVVLSLWGVLALPAAEVIFLQPGQKLEINAFRSWFLAALLLAELINFVATRYWLAASLFVIGQSIWLSDYLPLFARERWFGEYQEVVGLLVVASSLVIAWLVSRQARAFANPYDRLWFDFRDAFGLFWALRLSERVNDAATQAGWNFDLGWSGFRTKDTFESLGDLPAETARPLEHSLQGLLRRFVSPEWIAQRLEKGNS